MKLALPTAARPAQSRVAFTLIEMMISMSLMTLVLGGNYLLLWPRQDPALVEQRLK